MSRPEPHQHCHACGAAYGDTSMYPRVCDACGNMVWSNPIPVSVLLVPVQKGGRVGLLVIRRGIEPAVGKLALVGGFLESDETWQAGGAREVLEETGVEVDADGVEAFWFCSTEPSPNRVLLFGTVGEVDGDALEPFEPTSETTARGVVFGPDDLEEVFAFPLHAHPRLFQGARCPHDGAGPPPRGRARPPGRPAGR